MSTTDNRCVVRSIVRTLQYALVAVCLWPAQVLAEPTMNCETVQDVDTDRQVRSSCSGVADSVAVRYRFIDTSVENKPTSIGGAIIFGNPKQPGGESAPGSPDEKAKNIAKTRLRSNSTTKKIQDGLRKAKGWNPAEKYIEDNCGKAAKESVLGAAIVRDGTFPHNEGPGEATNIAFTECAMGSLLGMSPPIFVDGDLSDKSPNGLADILFHEGLHACFCNMMVDPREHHDLMEGVMELATRCDAPKGVTCKLADDKQSFEYLEPTANFPTGSLERVARSAVRWSIKPGTLVEDAATGERAVVYPRAAFKLPKNAGPKVLAAIQANGKPVHKLWKGALDELQSVTDKTLVREPQGPLYAFYGGALIPTTEAQMRSIGWAGGSKYIRPLWQGALGSVTRAPRDGTVVWEMEINRPTIGRRFVVYGGARFEIPDQKTFDAMGYDALKAPSIWDGGFDHLPTIPRDGTLLRTGRNFYVVAGGRRFRFPNTQTLTSLGYSEADARVLWPAALEPIPEASFDCDVEVVIDGIDTTTLTAGATKFTYLRYHVTNRGARATSKFINVTGFRDGQKWPTGHWQIVGPLAPGATEHRSFAVDEEALPVGTHTIALRAELEAPSCDTTPDNDITSALQFTVARDTSVVPSASDLTVTLDAISRSSWKSGDKNWPSVSWHATNAGTEPAKSADGKFSIGLVVDGKPRNGAVYVKSPLAPGASTRVTQIWLSDTFTVGRHTLRMQIDPLNGVAETNEANNLSNTITFEILPP